MYPMEEKEGEKFRDGLHIILRSKLNLYSCTIFRGWMEKAMDQEKLEQELEQTMKVIVIAQSESQGPSWKKIENERS